MNRPHRRAYQRLRRRIQAIVREYGAVLVALEVRRGRETLIRVAVDHPAGTTLALCRTLTLRFQDELAWVEARLGPLRWEVSSPGVDRVLRRPREFRWAAGRRVRIVRKDPDHAGRVIRATLLDAGARGIHIALQDQAPPQFLPWSSIANVRLDSGPA